MYCHYHHVLLDFFCFRVYEIYFIKRAQLARQSASRDILIKL